MSVTTAPSKTAAQIRQEYIDFFSERASHRFVPSSPVVPHDDPTLLFANAGMNQFKPLFLGQADPHGPLAGLTRAVNSQKCIRAGGKHNDLDDVGKDTYHHTFFEMLGNWSFGDYFKAEAIQWAWELLTQIWGLDPERLYATYFEGDPSQGLEPDREAYDLWCKYLPPARVLPGNVKDNFWEMGDTGPCGPCSELHYDGRTDAERAAVPGHDLVNRESPDLIEIWNLVFIQFNRTESGLSALPAKHVDTGMGFERIVRVLQGKTSNYDTDVFAPLFEAIRTICGAAPYGGDLASPVDTAYRVIADHIRTLTVAINDGAEPSNEGRGYVLRRILRRAVRYGRQTLGVEGVFLAKLVPTVIDALKGAFPELADDPARIEAVVRDEEEAFGRTLDQGLKLFENAAQGVKTIGAEDAFKLHDTYGFPIDLTQLMAEERGLTVDTRGFEQRMAEARELSRSGGKASADNGLLLTTDAVEHLRKLNVEPTDDFAKFEGKKCRARVEIIWNGTDFDENVVAAHTRPTDRFAVILDRTNHYAEMGGQVGDSGRMTVTRERRSGSNVPGGGEFVIEDTRAVGGYVLHIGRIAKGEIRSGDDVEIRLDAPKRKAVASNHTATHLLNLALRARLGEAVDQKGSLVAADRLRFDFNHKSAVSIDELADVEASVRKEIGENLEVNTQLVALEDGRAISGLRAVFGETYPDPVRVVSIGPSVDDLLADPSSDQWEGRSIEFCGGTHVARTGEVGDFLITAEEAVSKGVRRISAVTGEVALAATKLADRIESRIKGAGTLDVKYLASEVGEIAGELERAPIPVSRKASLRQALAPLQAKIKETQKQAAGAGRERAVDAARELAQATDGDFIVGEIPAGSDRAALLAALDAVRARRAGAAIMLISGDTESQKVSIVANVPDSLVKRGLKAGDWVREASKAVGGKGGGRPDAAQGGGTEPSKIPHAIDAAQSLAGQTIGGG